MSGVVVGLLFSSPTIFAALFFVNERNTSRAIPIISSTLALEIAGVQIKHPNTTHGHG